MTKRAEGRGSKVEGARVLVFRNRQRTKCLKIPELRRITLFLLRNELDVREHELCIHLVDAPEMSRMNENFLQHTGSTDVITFDHSDNPEKNSPALHGEMFISVPDAVKQAREFKTTWQAELTRYIIHGLLHLRGFDDLKPNLRREMKREEERLLKLLEKNFSLRELAKPNTRARKS